jgi:hypothetical protein
MWIVLVIAAAAGADAQTALETRFQAMDRDRNGFITANEAPRVAGAGGGSAWIAGYDSDGDARVSAREYLERGQASLIRAGLPTGALRN